MTRISRRARPYLLLIIGVPLAALSCSEHESKNMSVADIGTWYETPSFSRNYYVRPPGTTHGLADGSSWTNALAGLPEHLERGARYYVASGQYDVGPAEENYRNHVFDDPEQGELFIGIYKATQTSHGDDEGWEAAMGEGPASFGPIEIVTGYYILDGQVGEKNQGHGLAFSTRDCRNENGKVVLFPWNSVAHHIVLRHLDLGHCGEVGFTLAQDLIYGNLPITHFVLQSCYLHDANRLHILMYQWNDVVLEDSYFARSGRQQEAGSLSLRNVCNAVLRKNLFKDTINTFISLRRVENVSIYSNIFMGTRRDWTIYSVVENTDGLTARDVFIYGNTFYNLVGLNTGIRFWDQFDNVNVYNNLWANCLSNQIQLSGKHDYNAFFDNWREDPSYRLDETIDETHVQVLEADPFVDAIHENFYLTEHTENGRELPAPYDLYYDGSPRGNDGSWDRGALGLNPAK